MTHVVRLKAYFARFGEHFRDTGILGESEERVAVDENDELFPRRIEMNGNRDVIRMELFIDLWEKWSKRGHQCFLADNGLTDVDEDETFPVEPDLEPCLVNETREQEVVPYETPKQMKERIERFDAHFCEAEQKEKELERQLREEENEQERKREEAEKRLRREQREENERKNHERTRKKVEIEAVKEAHKICIKTEREEFEEY